MSYSKAHSRSYSKLAAVWSVVFGMVGLGFAVAPLGTGELLTGIAAMLGLGGEVTSGAWTVWWVLAVSLMATLTVLSAWSAREPDNRALYAAIMTSKLTSTALFIVLAITSGPAWLICAQGDGFVALTLWWARRRDATRTSSAGVEEQASTSTGAVAR